MLGEKGQGEFIRMGDWDHIMESFTEFQERLEDSTGGESHEYQQTLRG